MKPSNSLASLFLILSFFLATTTSAETTAGCHCFKDRAYKPDDTFAADDYILATSFNSLIANNYNIAKKQIVFLKMKGGIDPMDLIISLQAAKIAKSDFQQILNLRKQKQSWKQILFAPAISKQIRADKLLNPLQTGVNVTQQGPKIINTIIADFFDVSVSNVEKLRDSGLGEKEISLTYILSKTKGVTTDELVKKRTLQNKSWSEIANELGIAPDEAGKLILAYSSK